MRDPSTGFDPGLAGEFIAPLWALGKTESDPAGQRASSSTMAAPFSAIMIVGELVLPEVIRGMAGVDDAKA